VEYVDKAKITEFLHALQNAQINRKQKVEE